MNTHASTNDRFRQCPRCGHFIPSDQNPGEYPGALSRLDDKTEICSQCGGEEAALMWQGRLTDWREQKP